MEADASRSRAAAKLISPAMSLSEQRSSTKGPLRTKISIAGLVCGLPTLPKPTQMPRRLTLAAGLAGSATNCYWDPWFDSFTFLPGDGIFYNPFGWGFYSPACAFAAPYFYGGPYYRHFGPNYHAWGPGVHYGLPANYGRGVHYGSGSGRSWRRLLRTRHESRIWGRIPRWRWIPRRWIPEWRRDFMAAACIIRPEVIPKTA